MQLVRFWLHQLHGFLADGIPLELQCKGLEVPKHRHVEFASDAKAGDGFGHVFQFADFTVSLAKICLAGIVDPGVDQYARDFVACHFYAPVLWNRVSR